MEATGPRSGRKVDPAVIVATREGLHQVAEHVLSAARKTATGDFTLRPLTGGFGTPALPDGRVLAVAGTDLVVSEASGERRHKLTTVRAAAEACGIEPGYPWSKHPPSTPLEPDRELAIDADAARVLADWFALGARALGLLTAELRRAGEEPTQAWIYPEHFDLGMSSGRVNYGASPGDDDIPMPYLYVGPHAGPPDEDAFWNAPFGAARTSQRLRTVQEGLGFLREGHRRLVRP